MEVSTKDKPGKKSKAQMKLYDHFFEPFISEQKISNRVRELASEIKKDYAGSSPVMIGVLNGAFIFASDLVRAFHEPCECCFVKVSTYNGMKSSGSFALDLDLKTNIEGKDIIIIEDIIDSGFTLKCFLEYLKDRKPASVSIATLLFKPDALKHELPIKYVGFEIPNKFVIGYGLDYNEQGRQLKDIWVVKS